MKIVLSFLFAIVFFVGNAHANLADDVITFVQLSLLKHSRDGLATDWNKIEAKRKQFVQSGNPQMAQIAKVEADEVARRFHELDEEVKKVELRKARNDLRK